MLIQRIFSMNGVHNHNDASQLEGSGNNMVPQTGSQRAADDDLVDDRARSARPVFRSRLLRNPESSQPACFANTYS